MTSWTPICPFDDLLPLRGVAALVGGEAVAVVRVGDVVHAVGNIDPFTGASVLSRGLVVERGDAVALLSPLHKQAFDLATGRCLDDPTVAIAVHDVEVHDGRVLVRPGRAGLDHSDNGDARRSAAEPSGARPGRAERTGAQLGGTERSGSERRGAVA